MKKAIIILSLLSFNAFGYYEDPHQQFDMTHNMTNETTITFIQSKNVQVTCDSESRARGQGNFGYSVEACSFWSRNTCTIITAPTANFHTIGHEVRHCLQGNFHNGKNK
jgi:hypothetical protein